MTRRQDEDDGAIQTSAKSGQSLAVTVLLSPRIVSHFFLGECCRVQKIQVYQKISVVTRHVLIQMTKSLKASSGNSVVCIHVHISISSVGDV